MGARARAVLACAVALPLLAGCGGGDDAGGGEEGAAAERVIPAAGDTADRRTGEPRDTASGATGGADAASGAAGAGDPAGATDGGAAPSGRSLADAVEAPGSGDPPAPSSLVGDTTVFPEPADGPHPWTTSRVAEEGTARRNALVVAARTGRHDEYDRLVVDFSDEAGGVPGFAVEYVDEPLHECGSGNQIHPVGQGWLRVRMDPADAHTGSGRSTIEHGREGWGTALPNLRHVYLTCDFEATVTLVLAVNSPRAFRAFDLRDPYRLVVDVRR